MALCHLDYGFVPNVFTCSYVPNIFVDDSVSIIFTEGCAPVILPSLMAMCRSYYSYLWLCATVSDSGGSATISVSGDSVTISVLAAMLQILWCVADGWVELSPHMV